MERLLEARLQRIIDGVPGLVVSRLSPIRGRDDRLAVELVGQRTPVEIEFKRYANAAVAWEAVRWARESRGTRPLLLAEKSTAEAREILARHGVACVDASGFAHVEYPGLFIHTEGRPRAAGRPDGSARAQSATRLAGKSGLVAQALLLDPGKEWGVHVLAQTANVSPGLAHRVLRRLEDEHIIESAGTGPGKIRRVARPAALLDLWVEESRDRGVVRTPAFRLARATHELAREVAVALDAHGFPCGVTGAAAAARIAPSVTVVPVTEIWVTETIDAAGILAALDGEAVDSGHNLVVAQARNDLPLAFRTRDKEGVWMVNPVRLYLDLRADPRRGREQAQHIREEVIGF